MNPFKGKPIVSIADGERVGTVEDVLIDTGQLTSVGLIIEGKPGHGILPLAAIRANGKDAITVDQAAAVQWSGAKTTEGTRTLGELLHLAVVNSAGETE